MWPTAGPRDVENGPGPRAIDEQVVNSEMDLPEIPRPVLSLPRRQVNPGELMRDVALSAYHTHDGEEELVSLLNWNAELRLEADRP